ncbi:MAG TPA: MmgE/PrpD family protein [Micromonosporaceae bacterium]|nr:MmgE/PrpD family protein [Micromonosporaceae bacterium]
MTPLEELAAWAGAVRLDDAPRRVVELAKSQVLSQLAAVRGGLSHPLGQALAGAFGPPVQPDPARSAVVLAALGSWLHFDDTAYAGHLSNSTVTVPLAYALARGLDGRALLTAVIAANECAARITAAATLGPFRGQMAAHTHVAGAVAGRLRAEDAPARQWVDALGLAFAMPLWSLTHGFMASDARLLSSSVPVRLGLDACDAAAAGLRGAADVLDHPRGFLARFATVPLPEAVTAGLGRCWHTDTLSFKVHPSGPGSDAAVDCALALHAALGPPRVDEVVEVEVHVSLYTLLVHRAAAAYLDGPDPPLSAVATTTPYAVATALLTGGLVPADLARPAVASPQRWALAAKVRLVHDEEMTAALLAAEAPFGEAVRLAGERAVGWLRDFGGDRLVELAREAGRAVPAPGAPGSRRRSFATATKMTPARVVLHLADGTSHERRVDIPVGAAGPDTRSRHRHLVRAKFLATGGSPEVAGAVRRLDLLPAAEVHRLITAALDMAGREGPARPAGAARREQPDVAEAA